ncbi:MAG: hypothetical protein JW778_05525 [Candidatus Altiarchaeota archaeon]|nr:hypothetical protein [Candidatus Altiarchaeota archaeon]
MNPLPELGEVSDDLPLLCEKIKDGKYSQKATVILALKILLISFLLSFINGILVSYSKLEKINNHTLKGVV